MQFPLQRPKIYEYDRAIKAALLNWTSGIVNNMIKFNVEGAFDAWRELYNRYIPLAEDMQNIFIRELMSLKQVIENNIDAYLELTL